MSLSSNTTSDRFMFEKNSFHAFSVFPLPNNDVFFLGYESTLIDNGWTKSRLKDTDNGIQHTLLLQENLNEEKL